MIPNLPPLNSLAVFNTAAQTLSFTKAADLLFVTRSAVSHQIKLLENYFGVALFVRHNKVLELTTEGHKLANDMSPIFSDIKHSTESIRKNNAGPGFTLNLSATFNALWLIGKLHKFEALHPNISISFETNNYDLGDESVDFGSTSMDAAIRLGQGQWSNVQAYKLLDVSVQPVCSPTLLSGNPSMTTITDLVNYNWVHYKHLPNLWQTWLDSAGASSLTTSKRNIVLDNVSIATQAAVDGMGILPIYRPLGDPLLNAGSLVSAFNHSASLNESYYFVCPENHEAMPVTLFRDWIVAEANVFNNSIKDERRPSVVATKAQV